MEHCFVKYLSIAKPLYLRYYWYMKGLLQELSFTRIFLVVVLLAFVPTTSLVAATLEATYIEESNPIIRNNSDHPLEYNKKHYKVSFRVGTLTIMSVGSGDPPSFKELKLKRSGNDDEESELVSTEEIDGEDEFEAMLIAKITYCGSRTETVPIDDEDSKKLLKEKDLNQCTNPYPITIEFFMVIEDIKKASDAAGIGFQFESGEGPGNFQLEANENPNNKYDIPINGSTAPSSFVSPEFTDGQGSSFININQIDTTWDASLSIDQSTTGTVFDFVTQLSSPGGAVVGVANLTLGGYEGHPSYSVYTTFSDNRNALNGPGEQYFYLKHETLASYIPFTLFLAEDIISNEEPYLWSILDFHPAIKQKDLVVKVDNHAAASSVSGYYSDTIYVTISPYETNPFTP